MNSEYMYKDEKYNNAVKDIKAALLDIIVIENNKLAALEEQITTEVNEEKKQKLKEQQKKESEVLDKTLENINTLIKNIEVLDSINKEFTDITENRLGKVIEQTEDEDIKIAFEKAMANIEESQQQLSTDIKEDIEKSDFIQEEKEKIEEDINTISEGPLINKEEIKNPDDVEEKITEEEKSKEQVELVPELESVNRQLDLIKEQEDSIKDNKDLNSLEKTVELLTFKKITKKVTKAILVRQDQLQKLAASRKKQKALVEAKGAFAGYKYMEDVQTTIDNVLENEQEVEQQLMNQTGLTNEYSMDKERQIEDLMVKANIYYSEGETDKAQELYEQISRLNSEIGKENVKEKVITNKN